MKDKGILIVISGFSGAGKGTLMKKLLQEYDNYALSVSATTRKPRVGETDGVEYFFLEQKAFEEKIAAGGFIEYACYCNHYYGTPKDYVEKQLEAGKDVILEIEIQGALKVREQYPQAVLLFVTPPNAGELKRRLEGRGTESAEVIEQRIHRAKEEAEGIEAYDYIVINDDLEACTARLHEIILAAHDTPVRKKEFIENIRAELKILAEGAK
ncbi:MAG: guanylate kinase [Blautia sp.]|nr:guanylate kinase [Lachnoclostridium sp.]MCM1210662.1 guanylate kinase [Blautia sp.]